MLLWLWCRPATAAPIGALVWKRPYATGMALKSKKKKKKKESKQEPTREPVFEKKTLGPTSRNDEGVCKQAHTNLGYICIILIIDLFLQLLKPLLPIESDNSGKATCMSVCMYV